MPRKSFVESQVLTVAEASDFLGLRYQTIWNYLNQGKLKREKFKTLTLLSRSECEAYLKAHPLKRKEPEGSHTRAPGEHTVSHAETRRNEMFENQKESAP